MDRAALLLALVVAALLIALVAATSIPAAPASLAPAWSPDVVATYYINLDARRDRRKQLEGVMARAGVTRLHRVSAEGGEAAPWIGCAVSHLAAARAAERRGAPFTLVLEDDVEWAAGTTWAEVAAIVRAVTTKPAPTWGLCSLAHTYTRYTAGTAPTRLPGPTARSVRAVDQAWSLSAVLVARPFYRQWVASLEAIVAGARAHRVKGMWAADVQLSARHAGRGAWVAVTPSLLHQRPGYSDLEGAVMDTRWLHG